MFTPTLIDVNRATFTLDRQPQAHAALLTAYEMRVFDGFGPKDKQLSAYELSAITNVEELLMSNCQSVSPEWFSALLIPPVSSPYNESPRLFGDLRRSRREQMGLQRHLQEACEPDFWDICNGLVRLPAAPRHASLLN